MAEIVKFKQGTSQAYEGSSKAENILYFLSDTQQIMKGTKDYTSTIIFADTLPVNPIKGKVYIIGKKAYTYKTVEGVDGWFNIYNLEVVDNRLDSAENKINEILENIKNLQSTLVWEEDLESGYTSASDAEDINSALSSEDDEINIKISGPIDLPAESKFVIPSGKTVTINLAGNTELEASSTLFKVENGGTLLLEGDGVIKAGDIGTHGAISVEGNNATVSIDGITIDTVSESSDSAAYGIYVLEGGTVNMYSGTIKTALGSCISTNNTTKGGTINIYGGKLYSEKGYAIYNASQSTINISGGVIQGINARMGEINISDNAEIIPTSFNSSTYDDIGEHFNTSGCVWVGDTIAILAGTYNDEKGTDVKLSITSGAKVKSDFRAAIGIYSIDTKKVSNIDVTVDNKSIVTTSDLNYSDIKVYDHDYISSAANSKSKSYNPVGTSNINVVVSGDQIYSI